MKDDEIFRRQMASLGVRPLARGEPRPPAAEDADRGPPPARSAARPPDPLAAEEDALFRAAMSELRVLPDKDRPERPRQAPRAPLRTRADPRRPLAVEDQLDLHGATVDDALDRLPRFLERAVAEGSKSVLVITGKGHHSAAGVGVLRQAVEDWIRRRGQAWVATYSEAPRALGGRGAFLLQLRQ